VERKVVGGQAGAGWRVIAPEVKGTPTQPRPNRQGNEPKGAMSTGSPWSRSRDRSRTRVIVGIKDLGLHQEVLDWVERDPRARVVAATTETERLPRLIAEASPDAVLTCPQIAAPALHPSSRANAPVLIVVAEEMTVPVLREAIDARAAGVFAWPGERAELVDAIAGASQTRATPSTDRGRVIAVCGARGGAGSTFIATNLAAVFAGRGLNVALVDLDIGYAEVTVALGIGPQQDGRTLVDLVPVADELSPDHIEDALYRHDRGFAALLAPADPSGPAPTPGLCSAAVALLAGTNDVVVLHLPRSFDTVAKRGAQIADQVIMVTTLELFSLYGARRGVIALGLDTEPDRCRLLVNRLGGQDLPKNDVERVVGVRPFAEMRFDPAVRRCQGRGELLPARSRRAGKDLRRVAELLIGAPAVTLQSRER
jgi:MinD-like ATPase involved in chromosome partitioning or flagellar assembly